MWWVHVYPFGFIYCFQVQVARYIRITVNVKFIAFANYSNLRFWEQASSPVFACMNDHVMEINCFSTGKFYYLRYPMIFMYWKLLSCVVAIKLLYTYIGWLKHTSKLLKCPSALNCRSLLEPAAVNYWGFPR